MLEFLVFSEKRKNLFLLLRGGSKSLQEIRDSLKVTSSGIIPEIRKMEEQHLIFQAGRMYSLTELGNVLAEYLYNFEEIAQIFSSNPKYWNEHKISGIPHDFRLKLYELGNYKIFKSTQLDIFGSQDECVRNLSIAKRIKGIIPVLYPEFLECILNLAEKGVDVTIVIPREFLGKIMERNKIKVEKCIGHKEPCILVCDEKIEFDMTVTDFYLSLRLFLKDDSYDFYQNITSLEKSSMRWGEELFGYYERRSKKVEIHDI